MRATGRAYADFDYSRDGMTISFDENSNCNDCSSYSWSFGDGHTSSQKNPPPHTYSQAGWYTTRLTVVRYEPNGVPYSDYYEQSVFAVRFNVEEPNGGESWLAGSTETIEWDYQYDPASGVGQLLSVKIELLDGGSVVGVISNGEPIHQGYYEWTVGELVNGTAPVGDNYRIRVTALEESFVTDSSNESFSIIDSNPDYTITVSEPSDNDLWQAGQEYSIQWTTSTNISSEENMKIKLMKDDYPNDYVGQIINSTPNSGVYNWTITTVDTTSGPRYVTAGDDYYIRISTTVDGIPVVGYSDHFSVEVIVGCGDGDCLGDEDENNCPEDCGYCGDTVCGYGETATSCCEDCGFCGDGVCCGDETHASCPAECDMGFDGGFETTDGWTFDTHGNWPGSSVYRSTWGTAAPHSGSYAVALSNQAYGKPTTDFIAAGPGTHTLAAMVRGEMDDSSFGGYQLRAYFYDANQQALSPAYETAIGCTGNASCVSTTWSRKSGTVTEPSGTAYIKIRLLSHKFGGWIAYDDVELNGEVLQVATHGVDGGFEEAGGHATAATGWSHEMVPDFPATSFFRYTWGTAAPYSGSRALAVSNQVYAYPMAEVNAKPGTHTLSMWVKGEMSDTSKGGWILRVYFYDEYGEAMSYQNAVSCTAGTSSCLSSTWTMESGTVTTPTGAATAKIQLYFHMADGWMAIDDVAVGGTVLNVANHGIDGGFESADHGWDFTTLANFPASSVRRENVSSYVHSGSYSLLISNQTWAYPITDFIEVAPGTDYSLSTWMRGEMQDNSSPGGWVLRAIYYDAAQTQLSWQDAAACYAGDSSCTPNGLTWTQQSGVVTTPAGAEYMRVRLYFYRSGGWIAFDDVVIE
jgi:PKD repeat protein